MKTILALVCVLSIALVRVSAQCEGDCQNGYGKKKMEGGVTYAGNWKDGAMHGMGTLTLADGSQYVGQLRQNTLNGYGVFTTADGKSAQAGIFKANELAQSMDAGVVVKELQTIINSINKCVGDCQNGWGKFTYSAESSYEGQFKNGVIHGVGTYIMDDGGKYYGEFKEGNLNGYGVLYDSNGGVTFTGRFDGGKLAESIPVAQVLEKLKPKFDKVSK